MGVSRGRSDGFVSSNCLSNSNVFTHEARARLRFVLRLLNESEEQNRRFSSTNSKNNSSDDDDDNYVGSTVSKKYTVRTTNNSANSEKGKVPKMKT